MYYSLQGQLAAMENDCAVILCGGVGYRCAVSDATRRDLPAVGREAMLYTHLSVRENALELYGFSTKEERDWFRLLISVSSVGAKIALDILSLLSPERLAVCIASGDTRSLSRAQGVGAKIAQRLVLELKDKVGGLTAGAASEAAQAAGAASASGNAADAVEALVSFGYSRSDASLAVGRLDGSLPADQLIKQALQSLARV